MGATPRSLARDFSACIPKRLGSDPIPDWHPTVKSMAVEQTVRWHWEELFGKSLKTAFPSDWQHAQISSAIEAVMTTALLWFGAGDQNELDY